MMSVDRLQQAYLVRLWAVHRNGELLWRASIENIHTGERHAFVSLADLCRFLHAAIEPSTATPPSDATPAKDQNNV